MFGLERRFRKGGARNHSQTESFSRHSVTLQ